MNETIHYSRDSFDRFGDDLCQELLSYLSISDCFPLECVAKQWKRLIFTKQKRLHIGFINNCNKHIKTEYVLPNLVIEKKNRDLSDVKISTLEWVVKKCAFIEEIVIYSYIKVDDNVIDIISNNCRHLKTFNSGPNSKDITAKTWQTFGEKCGQTLRSIEFHTLNWDAMKALMPFTPHIKSVDFVDTLADYDLPDLVEISYRHSSHSRGDFELFANKYGNQIKSLYLFMDEEKSVNCLRQVSSFISLEKLSLRFGDHHGCGLIDNFGQELKLIASNCRLLNYLVFENDGQMPGKINFGCFRGLKTLVFSGSGKICLRGCKQLTHLKVLEAYLDKQYFDSIRLYAPQLTALVLGTKSRVTDSTLQSLTQLNQLKRFVIVGDNHSITKVGIENFMTNSKQIREIGTFGDADNIENLLLSFIERVNAYPKMQHKFSCNIWWSVITNLFEKTEHQLPNNLVIKNYFTQRDAEELWIS